MGRSLLPILAVACAYPAFAQLDSGSITITVSQEIAVPPDTAMFQLTFSSGPSTTLSEVMNKLQQAGISNAMFESVSPNLFSVLTGNVEPLVWNFTITTPLAGAEATIKALSALLSDSSEPAITLRMTPQTSSEALASKQCSTAGLIASARATAINLASAAQRVVGPILGESNVSRTQPASSPTTDFEAVILNGAFPLDLTSFSVPQPAVTCTMTVKFGLGTT